ncbi:hypothetical protein O9992_00035 [Vibrio lentus]|nr:hypothetical protein [Vibrio lentus]
MAAGTTRSVRVFLSRFRSRLLPCWRVVAARHGNGDGLPSSLTPVSLSVAVYVKVASLS